MKKNIKKVYVVDDERIVRVSIADELRDSDYYVFEFSNPKAALLKLKDDHPDVIISDMKMPEMSGIEFIEIVKNSYPEIDIIVMTAFASIDNAVKAMKLGAYDYLTKPFQPQEMSFVLERLENLYELKKTNSILKKQIKSNYDFSNFIASPAYSASLFDLIKLILDRDTTVLIQGETGTGKELLTNIIHYNSNRQSNPLVKVSCAILAKEVLESELFGHVKGAFTGADKDKEGRFEMANNGTLYLDDIDDMPLDLQVKLLRVLEEGEVERVGGIKPIKTDIRIIASTKADLKKMVEEGTFRRDLYYRLNVFPIEIAPLRERKNDINVLTNYFYKHFAGQNQVNIQEDVYKLLNSYDFPGNVRELKNLLERMVLISNGESLSSTMLPEEIKISRSNQEHFKAGQHNLPDYLDQIEANIISTTLIQNNYNKSKTAQILGIPLSTLRTKMERLNLS